VESSSDDHGSEVERLRARIAQLEAEMAQHRMPAPERGSDWRRIEQEHHAQKLESLGVLAGSIAHDFSNWLTVIRSYATLAARELPAGSSASAHLQRIEQAAGDAADLCRQLLAYAGMRPPMLCDIEFGPIVSDLAELLRPALSHKAELRVHVTDQATTVAGDPAQLKQAVMNLLTNASDSLNEEAGTIDLRVDAVDVDAGRLSLGVIRPAPAPGNFVQLQVRDSGCGMPPETVSRLFEPFFTTKFRGRGLGLSAIVGVVRSHMGTILIDSEVGRGTTFTILLPRTVADECDG
jgi:two-component system cell cycle sensor histidine kinase/response regulator CckA